MITQDEVIKKRIELENLENDYLRQFNPCENTKCQFHEHYRNPGHCGWTIFIDRCRDYTDVEPE